MQEDARKAETDERLATLVQEGDADAFGELIERYEPKLARYGKKFLSVPEDIEDIVQDVFMKAFQNIQSFDATRRFSPWIYRIAHNAFVNELKRRSLRPVFNLDFDALLAHAPADENAETEREAGEMRAMIDAGLERITPAYREVLVLHYLEELSYKDIADILRIPVGTVGVRIMRARNALRKEYEKMDMHYE